MSPSDQEVADPPAINVRRFASRNELERALGEKLAQTFARASASAPMLVMLSGGNTPQPVYRALAQSAQRSAEGLYVCCSDERLVPLTSDVNNYRMLRPMLDAMGVPEAHRMYVRTELPAEEAARDYERQLQYQIDAGTPLVLSLLGMGADGHTAGLFTHDDLARARGRLAISVQRADGLIGVTVTPELLNRASEVLLAIAGRDKQRALNALLARDPDLVAWQVIRTCANVQIWTEPDAYPDA
ncbi:MAG TPA: 6-phosphogluconolactonase [Steroidobacteraceae bacterium]